MNEPHTPGDKSRPRRRGFGRRALFWTGLPLLALGGLFAGRAWAHGGFGGGCHHRGGARTPEALRSRMQWMVDRAFSRVDASDDQRAQAEAIVDQRAPDLHAVHAQGRALRGKLVSALRADDRAQLESLRKQGLDVLDRGSTLWLATVQELADILAPEQREALLSHLDHGPWHAMD